MGVFRVNKTGDYTVMSNYHLKERDMSLKAKGLLSIMLSLPDDWDYSVAGLCAICAEKESSIKGALNELKKFGYLSVQKVMPGETESGRIEYIYNIFEHPAPSDHPPAPKQEGGKQGVEKQGVEIQPLEIQGLEIQALENRPQLNTKESSTKELSTKGPNTKDQKKASAKAAALTPDFSRVDFSPALVAKVEEWLRYKQERREGYKPTGLNALISEIEHNAERYGEEAVMTLITSCMASNWRGIIFDKLKGLPERKIPALGGQSAPGTMPETNNEFARLRQRLEGRRS